MTIITKFYNSEIIKLSIELLAYLELSKLREKIEINLSILILNKVQLLQV